MRALDSEPRATRAETARCRAAESSAVTLPEADMSAVMTPADAVSTLLQVAREDPDLGARLRQLLDTLAPEAADLTKLSEALRAVAVQRNRLVLEADSQERCFFCLKDRRHVRQLVTGPHAAICEVCINNARGCLPLRWRLASI